MLNDASGFHKIYLATGYTDLRRGMEGLANIIRFRFHLDPYDRNTLFLFCGKRTDRIKVVAMVRLRTITHLSVVSSRQRSYDRLRCEKRSKHTIVKRRIAYEPHMDEQRIYL